MNPNLTSLSSLQMRYDTKLQQYNQYLQDFLQESEKYSLGNEVKKEQKKIRKRIKNANNGSEQLGNLKLDKDFFFSDDILLKAVSNMKARKDIFEVYPNTAYWGSRLLSSGIANDINTCVKRCQANDKCTGAWFEQAFKSRSDGYCQLRAGAGPPGERWMGRTAIMNKLVVSIGKIQSANRELLALNKEITEQIRSIQPNVDKLSNENTAVNKQMSTDYLSLVAQKEILDNRIQNYDSAAVSSNETEMLATQSLLKYRFFMLIFVLFLCIPVVIKYGPPSLSMSMIAMSLILMVMNMKTTAFYLLALTIIYLAYSLPLESPI